MVKVYVKRDDKGEITGMAAFPAPDMDPPMIEEIEHDHEDVKKFKEKNPLPHPNDKWAHEI